MGGFVDPYYDYKNKLLKNLLGIDSYNQLRKVEAEIVHAKQLQLGVGNVKRTNNFNELLQIHKFLFDEIYDWAGKIRTVDIFKNHQDAKYFLIVSRIPTAAKYVFNELKDANFLQNLSKKDFVEKLAYFYDQLNFIHPFREGNGRAQRVFWDRVAHDAGYFLDWSRVADGQNDTACRLAAETQDLTLLIKMFDKIVETV
jgi:cell filamentation protein